MSFLSNFLHVNNFQKLFLQLMTPGLMERHWKISNPPYVCSLYKSYLSIYLSPIFKNPEFLIFTWFFQLLKLLNVIKLSPLFGHFCFILWNEKRLKYHYKSKFFLLKNLKDNVAELWKSLPRILHLTILSLIQTTAFLAKTIVLDLKKGFQQIFIWICRM